MKNVFLHLVKNYMKRIFYILILVLSFTSCNEYQKALKSEDIATKFKMGEALYNEGKWAKANKLFVQIVPNYRGKPQAEKLMYLYADTFYQMKDFYLSGYQFERFAKAYPKSTKLEEAYYKSALSYGELSPVYSKEQEETATALEKLQLFANLYPNSSYMPEINKLVKDLNFKMENKAYSIARQYNLISDYKASIAAFDNFLSDFPGTSLREKALYYRFNSAYELGTRSVEYKKQARLEKAKSYFSGFKKAFPNSEFIEDATKMNEVLTEQLEQYSTKS